MNGQPTPETDAVATTCSRLGDLIEALDAWIEDAMKCSKPIGLTLSCARVTITDQHDRIGEILDALEHQNREVAKLRNDCIRALHERDEAREEVKRIQHWATVNGTIQMQHELTELARQRDSAIKIGLDAVGQLIEIHHTTSKRERNIEWECQADLLDRNFRSLEDLLDSSDHP